MISVVKPGLISSFQDLGRWGSQPLGIPVSGAMDEVSHQVANLALGNELGEATLEMTMMGPTLRFETQAVIAWAGADLSPTIDGALVPPWTAVQIDAGATLQFGRRNAGMRAYLAVQGGYVLTSVMGSQSTYMRGGFGGFDGRILRKGDSIRLRNPACNREVRELNYEATGRLYARRSQHVIRLMPGREWPQFGAAARISLLTQNWRIGAQSDRMGYRLEGLALEREVRGDILSEPVSFGTVQVPPDGQPIVLMADRQTTGGYPKIAQIATVDLPVLAQLAPGDQVAFERIDVSAAQELLLERSHALMALANDR